MVTPIPQDQPYNVAEQYGRIGQAIQGVADAPLKAVSGMQTFQANELTMTKAQQDIDREKQRIKDLEEKGRNFEAYKRELAVKVAGSEDAVNALTSQKYSEKGRVPVGVEEPKPATGTEGLDQNKRSLVKKIMSAENKTELGLIMTGVHQVNTAYDTYAKKYPGATLTQPNYDELRPYKTGKDKYENIYPDAYAKQMETAGKTYLSEGVRDIIDETLKKAKINPVTHLPDVSKNEILQKVTKDPDYSERGYDPEFRATVEATFDDMWKKEEMRIKDKAAEQKGEAQAQGREDKTKLQNDAVLLEIDKKIKGFNDKAEKANITNYKALISTGQYMNPDATKDLSQTQKDVIAKVGTEVDKLNNIREISKAAAAQNELIPFGVAENIYDDVIDGKFTTPLGKKYGPLLGFVKAAGSIEADAPKVTEDAAAPAPSAAPAPKVTADEATIQEYMRMYPGKTREQIIKAIERSK